MNAIKHMGDAEDQCRSIHDTETVDRLFLELSQFTRAKTAKEVHLETMLKRANDVLRSAMSITNRNGECVNWDGFRKQLEKVLVEQHQHFYGHVNCQLDEESDGRVTTVVPCAES